MKHRFKNGVFVRTKQIYLKEEFLIIKSVHHFNRKMGLNLKGYVYNVIGQDGNIFTPIHDHWLELDEA